MIPVRPGPDHYLHENGVLDRLESLWEERGWRRGALIHGEPSWEAAHPYLPPTILDRCKEVPYRGKCTDQEVKRLVQQISAAQTDIIIGVGGGKGMDITKAVANQIGLPHLLIPTFPATCAAYTPLSVYYDESGSFIRYDIHPHAPTAVWVEPEILVRAPLTGLRAGIGDTLAKWYEAEVLATSLDHPPVPVRMGLKAALLCREVLLADGEEALHTAKQQQVTPAFQRVVDAILVLGGTVGGFAERYGRTAAAHSVHNGLTRLPTTDRWLHGDKVAYGILVQLALLQQEQEIKRLLPFYHNVGLPSSLTELGLDPTDHDQLLTLAQATLAPEESIHLMDDNVTVEDLIDAFQRLEPLTNAIREETTQ
ncbi:iron-containing alcohol dehydrogenase family protein [Desmospora activa]|uniref:Putative oxidoreductase n=1 Tax=Desmospora activa DSM 45169 TaxID=1121389 RepID=A0A2T4ZBX5_9BACL|nr:iron-containing alcohol dehydrogenase family protein [Desmospora activa]PTM59388.1 putative oxidoreductase [Desmospora activa DSM 45169]